MWAQKSSNKKQLCYLSYLLLKSESGQEGVAARNHKRPKSLFGKSESQGFFGFLCELCDLCGPKNPCPSVVKNLFFGSAVFAGLIFACLFLLVINGQTGGDR